MLYRPEAFEPLRDVPWDASMIRDAVAAIASDAEQAFSFDGLWSADEWDAWTSPTPMKNLYVGAAGVIWALSALRHRGLTDVSLDLAGAANRALDAWRAEPDFPAGIDLPSPAQSSLLCGQTGPLLVAWSLTREGDLADALHACVVENATNEANELMWGAPGTMIAARWMFEWTGDALWASAWRDSADRLLASRDQDGLWTQHIHGETERGLGPPHGLVGNVLALLGGSLDEETRRTLVQGAISALERTAVWEDGLVNWPIAESRPLGGRDGQVRLQWCMGAPGIVVSGARYLPQELVLAAAELVWGAGPHGAEKGSSICHGTAGNGYALLKAFTRTGDELWLERARRFAVHAVAQVERARNARGRGRYSLWTGDLGVALYAADCLDGRSAYPVLETWE